MQGLNFQRGQGDAGRPAPVRHAVSRPAPLPQGAVRRDPAPSRLAYRLNRINWIEAGWQYVMLDSDIPNRESYQRNRIDLGWKIQLF